MLRVIPLGGLGEVGLNSMVLECRGELLLLDCGVMFPTAEMPGIELVLPDFGYLLANRSLLRGVVLTHGHEDHVGALPYLLREVKVPVYGTRLTLGLVRHRLEEHGVEAELRELEPRAPFGVGEAFTVEAIRVCHSIPDGVALAIRTEEGTVLHSGDFKLDAAPIDDRPTDLERFGELGDEGVLCLLSDSTNSELEGEAGSEREVAATFERLFARAEGRIVVSMFASSLHRVQHLLELAERAGRKVALTGRSMLRNVELARSLGYLRVPAGLLVPLEESVGLAPSRLVVLTTGSQAEPRSGLVQLATERQAEPRLGRGDLVIVSSRPIPGNERAVAELIDELYARGAEVVYAKTEPGVHVSGHACRAEQRRLIETVRPRHFIPIHGELRQLHRHLALAREAGASGLLVRDGEVVGFEDGRVSRLGVVPHGRVFRDRFGGGEVISAALKERGALAVTGVVVALVAIDRSTRRLISGPQLTGRGLSEEEVALLPHAAEQAKALLSELSPELRGDEALVREELTRAVRRAFRQHSQKRPTLMPVVVWI